MFHKMVLIITFLNGKVLFHDGKPVFRGGLAGDPLEYPGEIIGIGIAAGGADVLDIDPGIFHHVLCLPDPVFVEVGGKVHMETLLEQLAEVSIGIVHGVGHILHGQLFHIMVFNESGNILPHQRQAGTFSFRLCFFFLEE